MSFLSLFVNLGLIVLVYMLLIWLASLLIKDSSIVDIFWGAGFVLVNWASFLLTPQDVTLRRWVLSFLVTLWGLRLSIHILLRNMGKGEDFRYKKWREESGKNWWWFSFFKVFLLQGFLLWIISTPLAAVHYSALPSSLTFWDVLGVFVWLVGFFFESAGDMQLARFKKEPANKGRVLSSGVWRYTRHPNYFGDAAQWWGYFLLAVGAGTFWTVFSPLIMTYLLLRVSGVTMLESALVERKPGYREYIQTTSAFIPWFPHRKRDG